MISVSGIYVIRNKRNNKVYIGKAKDIKGRWYQHRHKLNKMCHDNAHLQAAWNKYGEKVFEFKILEHCESDYLNEREKYHIAIYKARGLLYNMTDGGDGTSGRIPTIATRLKMSTAHIGHAVSESARSKISAANKGKPCALTTRMSVSASHKNIPLSEETKHRMSEAQKGKVLSDEHRLKLSEAKKGKPFSLEHRIKLSVAHKGKSLSDAHVKNVANAICQDWVLVSPDGNEYHVHGLIDFCNQHNLNPFGLYPVASGRRNHYKGWKCRKIET